METESLREDLEYKYTELEMMKKKFVSQLESLGKFSKQLRQKDIELIKLQEKLEMDKTEVEHEKSKIQEEENKHSSKIQKIKDKVTEICPDVGNSVIELKPRSSVDMNTSVGRFSPILAQIRTSTPVVNTRPPENDELSNLQAELSMLESLPQDSNTMLRINRIKTQISTIRSMTAIGNSIRNSVNNSRFGLEHKRGGSSNNGENSFYGSLNRSGCSSPVIPDASAGTYGSKRMTPRPPAPAPKKNNGAKLQEFNEEIETIRGQFKDYEAKLKEREDMLDERENRLKRNWMRAPNANELMDIVQKETKYFNIVKKEYEKKNEDLNCELVNVAKKAAEHKLLVNYHGAYKPSGLHRKYPNVINRESVRGLEYNKFSRPFNQNRHLEILSKGLN